MEFKGLINLTLVTNPILKTFKTNDGSTMEYYELTLSDGYNIYSRVSGSRSYDFTTLEVGKTYNFGIIPRAKNINSVSSNGSSYRSSVPSFKIVGVPSKEDIKKYLETYFK